MFTSFFPKPGLFFLSAALWAVVAMAVWYTLGDEFRNLLGLADPEGYVLPYTVDRFVSREMLFFYIFYAIFAVAFYAFWKFYSPHPWMEWSILGSALIIFNVYFGVQVSVALNEWRGPFFNMLQSAFEPAPPGTITEEQIWVFIWQFLQIAFVSITIGVLNLFFVSHWIFRWRTAMNNYFTSYWPKLRKVEGASQRVQEDAMRFASVMEGLGISMVNAVMTLVAFAPILITLGEAVSVIPFFGAIPYPMFTAAVVWSVLGTIFVALIGFRLPGLEFRNQRVEAAFRKELVLGEDDATRAEPITLAELFTNVRRNYFRLYFNYLYFNIGRIFYIQIDNVILYILLIPTIVAGRMTLGLLQQITTAFGQVSNSFQYLFNVWPTIVELISIQKRLAAFEAHIHGGKLSDIEREIDTPRGPVPDATATPTP
ncbi:MAG: peptide antibiotic transporter SbmA [Bauldia sp.]|nr:peptide antibiotic transporter SbmA [Bauldia sp.]